ncbi:PAS domain-containing protein [Polyangium aurulentum]|uniref:PAS domain-containing protein n=1 Tax=Polyangium aurulentum TaxID=2567896 RepID=UPI0010AEE842|nr:PAS domain-containing protein [Polyangium aurulentum]UQA55382.1 PAS domain-containing protein [Polyangium aurulentum]
MATPLRALLVEDSAEDATLLMRCLKRAGYALTTERVETAEDMHAALDGGPWDIVFSDHRMPLFSAMGALQLLRARDLDLPFIIVSGNIGPELVASAMQAGANDYVLKDDMSRIAPAVDRALRDVAERRRRRETERALQESEERFALAVRGSRDGLWDWNLLTGQVYYSARFKEMLGFEEHELEGIERFIAQIHPEDRTLIVSAFRDHLERQLPLDVELRLATKGGEHRWFCARGQALWDAAGRASRIAGSLSDLTARKKTEAELKTQLELIRQQQEAIRLLSAPIIEVWDGVLMVPVLGALDGERAQTLLDALLAAVVRSQCRQVIIDVTGVDAMAAYTAEQLVRIVGAIRLLGAQCIIVGIKPLVANALVELGIDLSSITTLANLRQALLRCMSGTIEAGARRALRPSR